MEWQGRGTFSGLALPVILGCRHSKKLAFSSSTRGLSGQEEQSRASNITAENTDVDKTEPHTEEQGVESSGTGSISLTSGAIAKLKDLRQKKGGIDLRLQVDGGGCSGFQYVFKLDGEGPKEDDVVIEAEGVRLLCDSVSMEFLGGSTVDYESDLMRSGFVVRFFIFEGIRVVE